MMRAFHHKAHFLQRQHDIPSCVLSQIQRAHVKISRLLMADRRRLRVVVQMEEEKFALRPHLKGIPHFRRFLQRPLQDISGISLKRTPVRADDVADQTRHLSLLRSPRKDLQRIRIRFQVQIRIFDPRISSDRRTVEHEPSVQRLLQLAHRHRHIFQASEQIRELQPDELHILFLSQLQNIFSGNISHPFTPICRSAAGAFSKKGALTLPVRAPLPYHVS